MNQHTSLTTLLLAFWLLTLQGCSMTNQKPQADSSRASIFDRLPWSKRGQTPEPYPNPVKVAATWTPDTLVQTGRTPTRGFGGRVFFYDEKSRAVPVDGTLIVHGFDDTGESQRERVKRFEFTPEQFTRHFSQSDLGASYSVWIPWDAIGGEQRRISLVTSFRTTDGKTVQGVPATVLLPGASLEPTAESELAKMSPQYQRYLEATRSAAVPSTGLTTTTIARRSTPRSSTSSPAAGQRRVGEISAPPSLAVGRSTPSAEIEIRRPGAAPTVQPASAQSPIKD
jgi:hypothetical protein